MEKSNPAKMGKSNPAKMGKSNPTKMGKSKPALIKIYIFANFYQINNLIVAKINGIM